MRQGYTEDRGVGNLGLFTSYLKPTVVNFCLPLLAVRVIMQTLLPYTYGIGLKR